MTPFAIAGNPGDSRCAGRRSSKYSINRVNERDSRAARRRCNCGTRGRVATRRDASTTRHVTHFNSLFSIFVFRFLPHLLLPHLRDATALGALVSRAHTRTGSRAPGGGSPDSTVVVVRAALQQYGVAGSYLAQHERLVLCGLVLSSSTFQFFFFDTFPSPTPALDSPPRPCPCSSC